MTFCNANHWRSEQEFRENSLVLRCLAIALQAKEQTFGWTFKATEISYLMGMECDILWVLRALSVLSGRCTTIYKNNSVSKALCLTSQNQSWKSCTWSIQFYFRTLDRQSKLKTMIQEKSKPTWRKPPETLMPARKDWMLLRRSCSCRWRPLPSSRRFQSRWWRWHCLQWPCWQPGERCGWQELPRNLGPRTPGQDCIGIVFLVLVLLNMHYACTDPWNILRHQPIFDKGYTSRWAERHFWFQSIREEMQRKGEGVF